MGKIRNARRRAYKAQRVVKPVLSLRVLRWCLPLCQSLAFLAVLGLALVGYLSAWQKTDQWSKFDGFAPATLEVLAVNSSRRGSVWLGAGRVDGVPTQFIPGELNAVLGAGPARADDPRLSQMRARLPVTMQVLWHADAAHRLLPTSASREQLRAQMLEALWVTLGFLVVAIISIALCIWLSRQRRLAQMRRPLADQDED